MNSDTLVSVCMITYNHEAFVSEAIESILMQNASFDFELIIGEDCGTDDTRRICQDYALTNQNITLLPSDTNLGIVKNFIRTLQACKSMYIAICEGDDYWTDPLKLQKQVDFLEKNNSYAGCAHQARVIYDNSFKPGHVFRKNVPKDISVKDLMNGRLFHTATILFRKSIIDAVQFPINIISADRALNFLIAMSGPIYYMEDEMCVYRKNDVGVSTWVTASMLRQDLNMIPWLSKIDHSFPKNRYKAFIFKTMLLYTTKNSMRENFRYFSIYLFYSFSYFPRNIKDNLIVTRNLVQKYFKT